MIQARSRRVSFAGYVSSVISFITGDNIREAEALKRIKFSISIASIILYTIHTLLAILR